MTFHHLRTPRPAAVPPAVRGLPGPMRRTALREALADRVERYLAIMDRLDGDPDDEPSLGSPEPAIYGPHAFAAPDGSIYNPADQRRWGITGRSDREEENEHGGDILDEPHDAETDRGAEEDEPTFGFRAESNRVATACAVRGAA